MIPIDEDAFLPTDNDRIKAQIKELKSRLAIATEKRRKLRRQLIEEDISYVVVSKITEGVRDPTRAQADELEGLQKQIFEQLLLSAEACCVQEIVSYHRLAGLTVFDYRTHWVGIRLETFYGKMYKEPYYILFRKSNPNKIDQHTIPSFIPVNVLEELYLPEKTQDFFRIVSGCLQAYVTRREIMNEIGGLSETHNIKVLFTNASKTSIELEVEPSQIKPIHVTISFENRISTYPTKAVIKDLEERRAYPEFATLENDLLERNIVEVLMELTAPSPEADDMNEDADEMDMELD